MSTSSSVEDRHLCEECGTEFTQKKSLFKHVRRFHQSARNLPTSEGCDAPMRKSRITCPECHAQVTRYSALRQHLEEVHKIALNQESIEFPSEQEFLQWKQEYETQNVSSYILITAPKITINGEEKRYYHCHRSYSYQSQTTQRNRKNIGTNKIGACCPSVMELIIRNNYVLTFWTTHVGHTLDVCNTFLKKETRAEIAVQLSQGVSFKRIIDDIRNSVNQEEGLQRVHLIERKDLHNISRDFNIKYATKHRQDEAVTDTDECREEFNESMASGITLNNDEKPSGIRVLLKKKLELAMILCEKNTLNSDEAKHALRTLDELIDVLNKGPLSFEPSEHNRTGPLRFEPSEHNRTEKNHIRKKFKH